MDWKNLFQAALTLVVGFALKAFFAWIGFELDEANFNALVGAVVAALLGLFLANTGAVTVRKARAFFSAKG